MHSGKQPTMPWSTESDLLKDKEIDATFVKAPGEHTWEFCDKYIKEFVKTLTL